MIYLFIYCLFIYLLFIYLFIYLFIVYYLFIYLYLFARTLFKYAVSNQGYISL
jgi:hypothetical protein